MIGSVVKFRLKTDPAVRVFVGGRVRPGQLCADDKLPAVTYVVSGDDQDMQLDGPSGLVRYQVEVNSHAWKYGQSRKLARAVRDALIPLKEIVSGINVRSSFHEGSVDFEGRPSFSKSGKAPYRVRTLIGFWVREDKPAPIL